MAAVAPPAVNSLVSFASPGLSCPPSFWDFIQGAYVKSDSCFLILDFSQHLFIPAGGRTVYMGGYLQTLQCLILMSCFWGFLRHFFGDFCYGKKMKQFLRLYEGQSVYIRVFHK